MQLFYLECCKTIINGSSIPTHYVNGEVVDKPSFLWTEEAKRKFEIDFKNKNFLVMSLNKSQFLYILNCNSPKKMQNTLEKKYGVSPSFEQERMNAQGDEDECECYFSKCFSTFGNIGSHVKMFITDKYLRVKNWNHKPDSILKSRDVNFCNFLEKSKEKIIEKLNEFIQLLKDEGFGQQNAS